MKLYLKAVATAAVITALAAVGSAQTFYRGNPNILVPKSDVAAPGHAKTNYLINIGASHRSPLAVFMSGNGQNLIYGGIHPFRKFGGPGRYGIAGFTPQQIQAAYQMPPDGGSQAIVIVDAYDDPTALSDFNTFASQFGLPTETSTDATASTNKVFQVVYASGTQPPQDSGWDGEISLDIEWAHAMAPKAKIYLVEGASSSTQDLFDAVLVGNALPNVREMSMSWGMPGEFSGELAYDSYFTTQNLCYFSSAGDIGGLQSYPAESPNVVGVGGTSLVLDSSNNVVSETAWDGSGGGPSLYESIPSYQSVISSIVGSARGCPDEAALADPNTGAAVYSSADGGWTVFGGTSLACPIVAGITNTRGNFSKSGTEELTRIYKNYVGANYSTLYRDITSGTAGTFHAATGWDFITGVGVPIGLYPASQTNQYAGPTSIGLFPQSPSTLISGDLASVQTIDGIMYKIQSSTSAGIKSFYPADGIVVGFTSPQPVANFVDVGLTFNANASSYSTLQVYAWNYTSNRYDYLGAFPGRGTNYTYSLTLPQAGLSSYVNGSNQAQFVIRNIVPARFGVTKLQTSFDMINLVLSN